MSESFPYFAIAQQLDVPYREVLAVADTIERIGPFDPVIIDRELYCRVENAVLVEQERRASVHIQGGSKPVLGAGAMFMMTPDDLAEHWPEDLREGQ